MRQRSTPRRILFIAPILALLAVFGSSPAQAQLPVSGVATYVGSPGLSTSPVGTPAAGSVQIQLTSTTALTGITASTAQGGAQEFTIGTVTGCFLNGSLNNSGTICTVPYTFKPAYPGLRSAIFSLNNSTTVVGTIGVSAIGTGPQFAFEPAMITEIAGAEGQGNCTDTTLVTCNYGGPATSTIFGSLNTDENFAPDISADAAVDAAGNVFVIDTFLNVIVEITAADHKSKVVAGGGPGVAAGGDPCPSNSADTATNNLGDGCPATDASLDTEFSGIGVDSAGNLYITDYDDGLIHKVDKATGIITAFASSLNSPQNVKVDTQGNVFYYDFNDDAFWRIDAVTQAITGVGGNTPNPSACSDPANFDNDGDGCLAVNGVMGLPYNFGLDYADDIYFGGGGDDTNNRVREISGSTGIITTLAGTPSAPNPGDGGPLLSAGFSTINSVAPDAAGNLYITDYGANNVRYISIASNTVFTLTNLQSSTGCPNEVSGSTLGNGCLDIDAALSAPGVVVVDNAGQPIILDTGNNLVWMISAASPTPLIYPTTTAPGVVDISDGSDGIFSGQAANSSGTQSITVFNSGNSALAVGKPSAGTNPSLAAGFQFDPSGTYDMPLTTPLTTSSSSTTLAAGSYYTYGIQFIPLDGGTNTGSLLFTGDPLNVSGASAIATLIGTGSTVTPTFGTMSFSPASTEPFGTSQAITISDTLSYTGSGPVPAGAVKYVLNGVTYAATCTGSSSPLTCTYIVSAGTIAALGINGYTVTAAYTADASYNAATGSSGTFTISKATPIFGTIGFSPASSEAFGTNQAITISDTLAYTGATAPTGTVSYVLNSVTYPASCSGSSSPLTCTATVPAATIAVLPGNSYTVTVAYAGDTDYSATPGTSSIFAIGNAPPAFGTMTFDHTSEPYSTSHAITISDTLAYTGASAPSGAVTYTLNGVGYTASCSGSSSPLTCTAIVPAATIVALAANSYTVAAVSASDANYSASIGAGGTFTITQLTPAFGTMSFNPTSVIYGTSQAVTISDTLAYTGATAPSGAVTYTLNGVGYPASCTGSSSPLTCTATVSAITVAALSVSGYTVTAAYTADTDYATATGVSGTFTVTKATPVFGAMSFTPASSEIYGTSQIITISDTLAYAGASAPGGTVKYVLNSVTYPASCSGSSSPLTCTATVPSATIAALTVNGYTVTAAYTADSNYNAAPGTSGTFTITQQTPVFGAMSFSPASTVSYGASQAVTISDTISYTGAAVLTGAVKYVLNGVTYDPTCSSPPSPLVCTAIVPAGTIVALSPNSYTVTASYTADTNYAAATGSSGTLNIVQTAFVVDSTGDTTTGVASNCAIGHTAGTCSLRDAFAAAAAFAGSISTSVTFDPAVFAAAKTITLANGTLTLPTAFTITGATSGSGSTLTDLVTINGANTAQILTVPSSVTGSTINDLIFTNGSGVNGGAITVSGSITVNDCTFSGNAGTNGGAINVAATGGLTLKNSTFSANAASVQGGAIFVSGSATIGNVTFSGNTAGTNSGAIYNADHASVTLNNSTFSGNTNPNAVGNDGSLNSSNNIYGNSQSCAGVGTPSTGLGCTSTNGANGNAISSTLLLSSLGSYGGPVQTILPLPGSPALGIGSYQNGELTTDARGYTRPSITNAVIDAGAVQTNYAATFTTQPPSVVTAGISFAAGVTLTDHGNTLPLTGTVSIPLAIAAATGSPAISTGAPLTSLAGSVANSTGLQVTGPATGATLTATIETGVTATSSSFAIDTTGFNITGTSSPASFYQGETDSTYALTVQNTGSLSTGGTVTVTDTAPAGLTLTAMSGTGWTCTILPTCTRADALAPNATYPPVTVAVTVASNAATSLTNNFSVSGGGVLTTATGSVVTSVTQSTFIVDALTDPVSGTASHCATGHTAGTCTLRDALAAANAVTTGAPAILFDGTVFSTAHTIPLASTLNITGPVTITGATSGSGVTLTNLVTLSGANTTQILSVSSSVTGSTINNLIFTNGSGTNGGAIADSGSLTVNACTFTGNTGTNGGAINVASTGVLTVKNSTFTGNVSSTQGGAIYIQGHGAVTVSNSTFSGNTATANSGGIYNAQFGSLTLNNSTFTNNTTPAAVGNNGTLLSAFNNILGAVGDCVGVGGPSTGLGCPGNNASGVNGNIFTSALLLSSLGSYGGPVQTILPLPGSPALQAGNYQSGEVVTDQRGYTRPSTTNAVIDSGALQTNYALSFSTEPPAGVSAGTNFTAAVTLTENAAALAFAGTQSVSIPIALSGNGTLAGSPLASLSTAGVASGSFQVSATGTGDTLTATVTNGGSTTLVTSPASSAFNVSLPASRIVYTTAPASTLTAGGNAGSSITVQEEDSAGALVSTSDDVTLIVTNTHGYSKTYHATAGHAVNGVATFNASADTLTVAGTYTYTAAFSSYTSAIATQTVSPAAAATLTVIGYPSTSSLSATGNSAIVTLTDQYGNLATNFTGTISVTADDPAAVITPSSYTYVSADAGVHSFGVVFNTATATGTWTITASSLSPAIAGYEFGISVSPATPTITWSPALSIAYGTTLNGLLNAAAAYNSVSDTGTATYTATPTSPAGSPITPLTGATVLPAATYSLGVIFAATNNYNTISKTVTGFVVGNAARATVTGSAITQTYGTATTSNITVTGVTGGVTPTASSNTISYYFDGNSGSPSTAAYNNTAGTATVTIPATLTGGAHTLHLSYAGDSNYAAATGSVGWTTSTAASTISGSAITQTYGTATTSTITVTGVSGGATPTTSGNTITYWIDTNTPATTAYSSGTASVTIPAALGAGTHTLHLSYGGDTNYNSSTGTVSWTTSTATPSISGSTINQAFGIASSSTITVTGVSGGATPTASSGTISYFIDTNSPSTASYSNGTATVSIPASLGVGLHTLHFSYGGDANYNSASGSVSWAISSGTTSATIAGTAITQTYGVASTSSITVTGVSGAPTPTASTISYYFDSNFNVLFTAALNSSGAVATATATVPSNLGGGAHTLHLIYGGDSTYSSATGSVGWMTTLAASSIGAATITQTYGTAATATVTVGGVSGGSTPSAASNTISYSIDSGSALTAAYNSTAGTASITIPATLGAGFHVLHLSYGGDANYNSSTGTATWTTSAATPVIAGSAIIQTYGAATSSNITVTGVAGGVTPTASSNTISYSIDSGSAQTAAYSAGAASITIPATLSGGQHTLHLSYGGDTNYSSATGSVIWTTATASPVITGTAITQSYGVATTSSITVTGVSGGAVPSSSSSTISYTIDSGSSTTAGYSNVTGTATINIPASLSSGQHTLHLSYGGDTNYSSATGSVTWTISSGAATATIAGSVITQTYGAATTSNITVTGVANGATPTAAGNTISYSIDTGSVLTAAYSNGTAVVPIPAGLTGGQHTLHLSYGGDTNYASATGSVLWTTVAATPVISGSAITQTYGTAAASAITVAGVPGAATPASGSGTISYSIDTGSVLTAAYSNGTAAVPIPATLGGGAHTLHLSYSGDANYSSAAGTVLWTTATATPVITGTAIAQAYGFSASSNITITGVAGGTVPTSSANTISYSIDSGSALTAAYNSTTGTAGITIPSTLGVGLHTLHLVYGGDADYSSASAAVNWTISAGTTPSTISGSAITQTYGAAATSSIRVTGVPGAATPTASGNTIAYYFDGNSNSLLAAALNSSGSTATATVTVPATLGGGQHTLHLIYGGDTIYSGSTGSVIWTTTPAVSTITGSAIVQSYGVATTSNITVTGVPGGATPTAGSNTISYSIDSGSTATAAYNNATGTATITIPAALLGGQHTLNLSYGGDVNYASSTGSVNWTISSVTLTVVTNAASMIYGQTVPAVSGTITGEVPGDGITATYSTTAQSSSPAGPYPIAAALHDPNNKLADYAVINNGNTLTIAKADAAVTLVQTLPTTAGAGTNVSVTFAAAVTDATTGSTGMPTGLVEFMDGAAVIGTSTLNGGVASFTTSFNLAAIHVITANYIGDGDFNAAVSSSFNEVITAPGYMATANPQTLNIEQGDNSSAIITLTPTGDYQGTAAFACIGLPAYATCQFTPATITFTGNNAMQSITVTVFTLDANAVKSTSKAGLLLLPAVCLAGWIFFCRRRRGLRHLLMLLVAVSIVSMQGCGSGRNFVTPAGNNPAAVIITSTSPSGTVYESTVLVINITQ